MSMGRKFAAVLVVASLASASLAIAQDKPPPVPPDNALKLSAIIATVEQRDGFHYVYDVEWNDDGYYDVVYFTTDKAKVEMKIDAVTGKAR
jgi:Peptidase propeptide and YPEB domain